MRAIILAAGRGSRINILTKKRPKALIEVNNKPIINYQIENLIKAKISKIAIVTGYKNYLFNKYNFKRFINKKWHKTNMIYSLKCADKWLKKYECIICYGDIFYDSKAIIQLKKSKSKFVLLNNVNFVKDWKKRFRNPLSDLESFKLDKKNYLVEIGKKEKSLENIEGQFMGLFKISPKNWNKIKKHLIELKKKGSKISTTELFNNLLKFQKQRIKTLKFNGNWFEIDNYKDLNILKQFLKHKS